MHNLTISSSSRCVVVVLLAVVDGDCGSRLSAVGICDVGAGRDDSNVDGDRFFTPRSARAHISWGNVNTDLKQRKHENPPPYFNGMVSLDTQ